MLIKMRPICLHGCKLSNFPFMYLDISLHFSKHKKEDMQYILDKIIKRISGWKGKLLSYKARLILLHACIASIPMFLLSFLKFPKWAIKPINSQMAYFFLNNIGNYDRHHLANWDFIIQKKNQRMVVWVFKTLGVLISVCFLPGLEDIILVTTKSGRW